MCHINFVSPEAKFKYNSDECSETTFTTTDRNKCSLIEMDDGRIEAVLDVRSMQLSICYGVNKTEKSGQSRAKGF